MALRDLESLQKAAEKLPPDEQLQLAQFLIAKVRREKYGVKNVDLSPFYGKVKLKEDPMEYQKRVRAEWP